MEDISSIKEYRIASGFAPFSPCSDRFNVEGYKSPLSLEKQFEAASKIEGLGGVGLDYPYQFRKSSEVRPLLEKYGLEFVTLEIGLYPDKKWKNGTYTSPDPGVRREAIEMSKRALDIAAELGAQDVLMWPGQDGFDYPFQSDYIRSWDLLVNGISEVASHRPDVRIAIEYKKQEPRTNCYIRNAGVLLSLLNEINMENVGGCVDLGHSLVIMKYTAYGKRVYGVGGNAEASYISGINVKMVRFWGMVVSAATAGLAGIIFVSQVGATVPTAGETGLLDVVTAVILGGISLSGGKGEIVGTLIFNMSGPGLLLPRIRWSGVTERIGFVDGKTVKAI